MAITAFELNRLRLMSGSERRRSICVCSHVAYYHRINSSTGECFTAGCSCDGFWFASRVVA